MPSTITTADSLIGSLCREVDSARQRSRQLQESLQRCQDSSLLSRLRIELQQLQQRRRVLLDSAIGMRRRGVRDRLALAFLIELCSRPVV